MFLSSIAPDRIRPQPRDFLVLLDEFRR